MKIALCLHGLFNSTTDSTSNGLDGFEYIKKNILSKGDVDIYIHSWEEDKKNQIIDIYQPKSFIFEKQKDFSNIIYERNLNSLNNSPRSPQNVLSHFYSISEVFKLMYDTNHHYDIVIKSRFDLGRINRNTSGPGKHNPYPVQCINFITNIEKDKIYMANWNHFNMGPADMWFYGDYQLMKNFTELYNSLESQFYLNSDFHKFAFNIENNMGDLSNSIAFYKWWMVKNGLWDKRINLNTTWE
jgi:hypothetical protein